MGNKIPQEECYVQIKVGEVILDGDLCIPDQAGGIVVFAHGTGSNRYSPRNQFVAKVLREVRREAVKAKRDHKNESVFASRPVR